MARGRKKVEPNSHNATDPSPLLKRDQTNVDPSPARTSARLRGRPALTSTKQADVDMEKNPDNVAEFTMPFSVPSTATKVLKEVAIPMRRVPSPSLSTASSALSQYREYSNEYETPGTSAAVTPAESSIHGRRINLLTDHKTNPYSAGRSITNRSSLLAGKGKRKRTKEDDEAEDFLLAQSLQAEEVAAFETDQVRRNREFKSPEIEDELDDSMDVDVEGYDFVPASSVAVECGGVKRAKLWKGTSLPSRAARDSAKKSITKTSLLAVPGIDDDEDDHDLELSDLESDMYSEEEEDVDVEEDDDVVETDAVGRPVAGAASGARSGARRRSRGSRYAALRAARSNMREWNGDRYGTTRARRERMKLEAAHPEIKTLWTELEAIPTITPARAQQPESITCELKSFQLEGLDWMRKQEQSKWKGGLLGDEMGMGKTVQAVSLIMSDYPAKDPTLVVVPPVALMQWQDEIKRYTNGKLNVLVHHNTDPKVKKLTLAQLKGYDVIMISYSGLESTYRKQSKGWKRKDESLVKENSKIHAIKFHRLILDEAHNIKSRDTGVAKASFALKAQYKWCLSGTPVQNRIGEFFSLLRFLQVKPFACYFCKMCDCSQIHLSKDAEMKCTDCKHTGFQHVSVFNQELLNPITQGDDPALRKAALGKLKLLTDRIMLRRMKRDHTASMELPPKDVIIHNEFFGEIERDFASSIMSNTARAFDTYVARGTMLNNYANIFGLIMQMRQVANHPDLILKKGAERGQNVLVCNICDGIAEEPIRSKCHHEFCRNCAKECVRSFDMLNTEPDCPRCHIPLEIDFDQPDIEQDEQVKKNSIINRIKMEDWTSSTKIEMLIYDLYKLRSKKQTHKSIVFSQFTSMLQLVEWRLRHAGFSTVMLDGSMTPAQRKRSIEYFMNNVDVEVFLVSLKAGGVALNLTEASRVFIIDPWWNPAAEWQSADRCHRIGQKRPCVITRLCIEDSVESRMVLLQEKKANMINGTINNDTVAMEKLSPEDMQFLFRGS